MTEIALKTKPTSRIGIVTGGGDCPGLNAVISSLVRCGSRYGYEFTGFIKGYEGLIGEMDYIHLNIQNTRGISQLGGTILKTTNHGHFAAKVGGGTKNSLPEELINEVKANLIKLNIETLIVIGGDGTLSTAQQLQENGINVIGIPKSIDNDLKSTDHTFGFNTSVDIVADSLAKIHTTAASHDRIFLVETMGRNTGWLTLYGGIAGGSDMILIPEIPFQYQSIIDFLRQRKANQRNYALITVAEAATTAGEEQTLRVKRTDAENILGGVSTPIAKKLEQLAPGEFEIRTMVLGHLQRGGPPNPEDRILAFRFGYAAIDALNQKSFGQMVTLRGSEIKTVPIAEAVSGLKYVTPDSDLVKLAKSLGISFGE